MSHDAHSSVLGTVAQALERSGVGAGTVVLAAVSGGADSVAMLHALHELEPRVRFRLAAAHLNHGLRGAESDCDEAFVRELCGRLGVAVAVERASGLRAGMPNLEEAARIARHDFLRRTADRLGASHVALAHNADDQAETVVMRLLRGAGISGMGAMAESGPGRIVRPMLTLERATIERYLRAIGASWVEDSSNGSAAMLRNRVRHALLPHLEREYAPGLRRRLVEIASEMRSVDAFVSGAAAVEFERIRRDDGAVDLPAFAAIDTALQGPVLRLFLAAALGDLRRVSRRHVRALLSLAADGPPNGSIALPHGWRAVREYSRLTIVRGARTPAAGFSVPISFEGETVVAQARCVFHGTVVSAEAAAMPANQMAAIFDLREIGERPLIARNFSPGDRIRPLGANGTRKVKEIFIDRKLPRADRARFPLVAAGAEILWLPGLVRSDAALVTNWSEAVLRIEASPL